MKFYAKTYYEEGRKRGETIEEHTEGLLKRIEELRNLFAEEIDQVSKSENFWNDLKIACLLHDLGKISTPFQNKIRKALDLPKLPKKINYPEIPHNYISPSFLTGISELRNRCTETRRYNLLLAIAFHHERPFDFDKRTLDQCLKIDIEPISKELLNWIKSHLNNYGIYIPKAFYYSLVQNYIEGNNEKINNIKRSNNFILLKGLLHRLDYAASAHVPVETSRLGDTTLPIISYLNKEHGAISLKPFQKSAQNFRNQSIIATASTGTGKTEFAVNWLGDSKGFYTLPLRASSNAMYKRLAHIFGKNKIGLLHSDSYSYLTESNENLTFEEDIHKINISRQLSLPLTVTTADQLFTSVFKWPGYERIYATLAYSKVILDEPQGYSPKTLAMIIRCIEELSALGCHFCYMSATNHPFIIQKLEQHAKVLPPKFNKEHKHKVELIESQINSLQERILSEYRSDINGKKVLVITNTVKKSQELYCELSKVCERVKLLHSGFIKSDREKKEIEIQNDFKNKKPVIWISTQIVEASLDIDYDILITEAATLDSLVQRMGRIFRRPERKVNVQDPPNVLIATKEPSDKYYIYNKSITLRTIETLKQYHHKILTDEEKQVLMDKGYCEKEIKDTKFFKDFENAYQLLKLGFQANNKNEAQRIFREISQISGIPVPVYERNDRRIDELILKIKSKGIGQKDLLLANYKLNQFVLSTPSWRKSGSVELFAAKDKSKSIFLIPGKYDNDVGLQANEIENIF